MPPPRTESDLKVFIDGLTLVTVAAVVAIRMAMATRTAPFRQAKDNVSSESTNYGLS